jgi:hypothetical protein
MSSSEDVEVQIIVPGHSSGEPLSEMLRSLTAAIEEHKGEIDGYGMGGEHGYGSAWDGPVFTMRRFYWGDCDCGADVRGDAWHKANPHAEDCFRTILQKRFADYDESSGFNAIETASRAPECSEQGTEEGPFGSTVFFSRPTPLGEAMHKKWSKAYDEQRKAHARLTRELYDEFGLPRSPYQWHCSCGVDEKAKTYFATEGHYPTCSLELPNFRHHASGFEVRWYKWIGRDNETINQPANLTPIFNDCLADIRAASADTHPEGQDPTEGLGS